MAFYIGDHITTEMVASATALREELEKILPNKAERERFAILQAAATIHAGYLAAPIEVGRRTLEDSVEQAEEILDSVIRRQVERDVEVRESQRKLEASLREEGAIE